MPVLISLYVLPVPLAWCALFELLRRSGRTWGRSALLASAFSMAWLPLLLAHHRSRRRVRAGSFADSVESEFHRLYP